MSAPLLCGVLTLTPTHCGTGQTAGAIDLPIAREVHTGLPVLPASTLKGVLRDWFGHPADGTPAYDTVKALFGPRPPKRKRGGARDAEQAEAQTGENQAVVDLAAGQLVFLEGMLLAFPVRSLSGVYRMVTAPMLIHRLRRTLTALGAKADSLTCPTPEPRQVLLPAGQSGPVSLEDLVFSQSRCRADKAVSALATRLGAFVAREASDPDRTALAEHLVVVTDAVLSDLTRRGTNVTARIVLDPKTKTSDNLWYEETLPPDTLFATVIADRPGVRGDVTPVGRLQAALKEVGVDNGVHHSQIGGNITVGQGWTRWTLNVEVG